MRFARSRTDYKPNNRAQDTPLPDSEFQSAGGQLQNAGGGISGTWYRGPGSLFIAGAILLLVCAALTRTYHVARTPNSRTASTFTTDVDAALQATKSAFAFTYYAQPANQRIPQKEESYETRARTTAEIEALARWRKLAAPNHPVSTRRLGLTLFLFGRQGGLNVLLRLPDPGQAPVASKSNKLAPPRPANSLSVEKLEEKPGLTWKDEEDVWRSLYGHSAVPPGKTPVLRDRIGQMHLGWFENIALEQLYTRAGMVALAARAHREAYNSASRLSSANEMELLAFITGIFLWMAIGLRWLIRCAMAQPSGAPSQHRMYPFGENASEERAAVHPSTEPSQTLPFGENASEERAAVHPSTNPFSYRARTTAFAVFLAVYLFLAYPVRLLIPDVHHWSSSAVLRLSSILQMALYIPVVLAALFTLRTIAASESVSREGLSIRQMLAALGLRSSRPLADIAEGVRGYILVLPLFVLSAALAARVFSSVHTPVNPVQIEAMSAISPLDQLLLLIETAIAAPFVEELMFRGLLFPALRDRWGLAGGVFLTSAVFGLLHPNLPAGFFPLWTLGASFAIMFQRRQSLLPCIVMHSLHNGFVTIMMFMVFAK